MVELGPLGPVNLDTGGPCPHTDAIEVRAAGTDELVAWLCPACNTQLPAGWKEAGDA